MVLRVVAVMVVLVAGLGAVEEQAETLAAETSPRGHWADGEHYHYSTHALPILDGQTAESHIVIGASEPIHEIKVALDISHTFVGDLTVELQHMPSGNSVILIDRPGHPSGAACPGDDIHAVFADWEATPVENQCGNSPAITDGRPQDSLIGTFGGHDLSGDWRLLVTDSIAGDSGVLNGWGIRGGSAAIDLSVTVSGSGPCSGNEAVVATSTTVEFCYVVRNTGSVPFVTHTLVDDELGTLLSEVPILLEPLFSTVATATTIVLETTAHHATWTARTEGGLSVATSSTATVVVPLCQGSLATIVGTDGPDSLVGTEGVDVIHALGGDDTVDARGEGDLVCGGMGDDAISGGSGDDFLYGEEGNDRLFGQLGNDVLIGGPGDDLVGGGPGRDHLRGDAGEDNLNGGHGADELYGGDDTDRLTGFTGKDKLFGQGGWDALFGGPGNDRLSGGPGHDIVRGGVGNDIVTGELGNDRLHGNAGNDDVSGNAGDDLLLGHEGDDLLKGGPGFDTIAGGPGSDTCTGGEVLTSC